MVDLSIDFSMFTSYQGQKAPELKSWFPLNGPLHGLAFDVRSQGHVLRHEHVQ